MTGNEATALGCVAASALSGRPLVYSTYPITPASDILHQLSGYKNYGIKTFQAEDEIAAIGAALGASYGGALGLTGTSGPGMALKAEMLGLAVMVELPLVVVNVQRGGPSTGLPTKTEQSDLFQALYGRNGESPLAVVAPASPADCFDMAIEAWRIALKHMTPVVYLSDAFLANGTEPWPVPDAGRPARPRTCPNRTEAAGFYPYDRDAETLARPWVVPGTPGLEHRIGGLEKLDGLGTVSYDPDNHHRMTLLRAEKVARIARDIAPLEVFGPPEGDLLILGWGSTYGAIRSAVERLQARGKTRRPRPPSPPEPVPVEHRRRRPELPHGADPRGQPGPAADRHPGGVPRRRDRLQPRAGQAVRHRRDRDQGRAAARRPVRPAR